MRTGTRGGLLQPKADAGRRAGPHRVVSEGPGTPGPETRFRELKAMHLLDPGTQLLRRFPSHTGQWLSSASLGFLFSPICTHTLLLKPSTCSPTHSPIHPSLIQAPAHPPTHPSTVCLAWLSHVPTQVPSSAGHLLHEHRSQPDPCSPEREASIRLCLGAPGASWLPLRFGFKALWVELRRGQEKAVA